jgi:hypothetical protein
MSFPRAHNNYEIKCANRGFNDICSNRLNNIISLQSNTNVSISISTSISTSIISILIRILNIILSTRHIPNTLHIPSISTTRIAISFSFSATGEITAFPETLIILSMAILALVMMALLIRMPLIATSYQPFVPSVAERRNL